VSSSPARRASYREVFSIGEFRALWASQVLSVAGDRLALVALALLVYDRTRSPLLAAIAYAAGYVPYVAGALFLSGIADRLPRRQVMVGCDVIRAVLVVAMIAPRVPLDALIALLYATTAIQPPFDAARSAIMRDVLPGERYALGAATMQATFRVATVTGAAAGGLATAFVGARPALAADAATFVASALLIRYGTGTRPAAETASPNALAQLAGGFRLVFCDSELRILLMLGWLAAWYAIPVGIAAPYARSLGGGSASAGLLIASVQVGAVLITPFFTSKIGPLTRLRWMGPMAACTCGTLLLTAFHPDLGVSMAIFALSGTFSVYQIAANTAFVERVPNERRAQAFGLANAGLVVGQGLAFMGAGAAVEVLPPSTVIAAGGGLGAVMACGLALSWRNKSPAVGRHSARHFRAQAPLTRQAPMRAVGSRVRVH
jgi:predicted MFS family arabinose efflux permease